jgi:hypothetical protein
MNITVKINNSHLIYISYQSVMMFKLIISLCLSILKISFKFQMTLYSYQFKWIKSKSSKIFYVK